MWINIYLHVHVHIGYVSYCFHYCVLLVCLAEETLDVVVACHLVSSEMARSFATLSLVSGCNCQSGISVDCRNLKNSSITNIRQLLIARRWDVKFCGWFIMWMYLSIHIHFVVISCINYWHTWACSMLAACQTAHDRLLASMDNDALVNWLWCITCS